MKRLAFLRETVQTAAAAWGVCRKASGKAALATERTDWEVLGSGFGGTLQRGLPLHCLALPSADKQHSPLNPTGSRQPLQQATRLESHGQAIPLHLCSCSSNSLATNHHPGLCIRLCRHTAIDAGSTRPLPLTNTLSLFLVFVFLRTSTEHALCLQCALFQHKQPLSPPHQGKFRPTTLLTQLNPSFQRRFSLARFTPGPLHC